MKKVTIKLNGVYIGSTEMTVDEIRKAENIRFHNYYYKFIRR